MIEFELILRTAAAFALCQLIVLLMLSGKGQLTYRLAAVYALGVLAFVLTSSATAPQLLGTWQPLWVFLCVIKGGVFWLIAQALFSDRFVIRPMHMLAIAGLGVYGLTQQLYLYSVPAPSPLEQIAGYGFDGLILALVGSALYAAWRDYAIDLVEQRRRLRLRFIATVGAYLALAAGVQMYNQLVAVSTPAPLVQANLLLMTVLSLAASASLVRPRGHSWLSLPTTTTAEHSPNPAQTALLDALRRATDVDKIYRVEKLSIGQLAAHLQTPEYQLRQAINEGLGHRNFNDFLHAHRIAEASEKLTQPDTAKVPVLTLAMDVGYASIGPFNRAFKERTGLTPTRYRQQYTKAA